MANLAIVGSRSVNGAAALHSQLIKISFGSRFLCVMARPIQQQDQWCYPPAMAGLLQSFAAEWITRSIGESWITNFAAIRSLEVHASEEAFQQEFLRIKRENKIQLATLIYDTEQVCVDPNSLFDVQVKRIHEYKRQLLNAMYVMHWYSRPGGRGPNAGGAAHPYLRRQGSSRLRNGQAHHQVDQ